MKKSIGFISALLLGFVMAVAFALPIASVLEANPLVVATGLTVAPLVIKSLTFARLGFMPTEAKGAFMAVQKENWVNYIIENLFKDNSFLQNCVREDDSVLNGTVVHIPNAGAKPNVRKNRTTLPGVVTQRADQDVNYPLDWYTTDPRVITNAEDAEVSYDKIGSVIGEDVSTLDETIADDIIYKWAPTTAAQIIRTSGSLVATALATGATGTRRAFMLADIRKAKVNMNKAGIPKKDRYMLIDEDMASQLMEDPAMERYTQQLMDLKEGTITRLEGFTIYTRASVLSYDNTSTPVPKDIYTLAATSDNLAAICWQKQAVALAMGKVDFFENKQDALYYGDVYSSGVRAGGRKRRYDNHGVVAIVQTAS